MKYTGISRSIVNDNKLLLLKQLMRDLNHRANVHEAAVLVLFECPEVGFVEFKKPEWRVDLFEI